ncbi:DEKNAAC100893 [Brettanomyces naardenensis]|uniref:DEKNAAC100893 n=1 Tax=Brettanomyces naardenensis TaxID=13370 RepID=A0A448YF63_BRENA|nr:DEKNAAC100893 [Brettanomyces naardenensis]
MSLSPLLSYCKYRISQDMAPYKNPKRGHGRSINHKREKLYNSRIIRTELDDKSFTNPTVTNSDVITIDNMANKLDVPSFLRSREFEIKSFEKSQLRSRYSSATRVFQSLPRELRRRTASHNVRRIPKRMRPRALKEMGFSYRDVKKETKGVSESGKPLKKAHPRGRQLYKLRRKSKLLKYAAKHKLSGHLIDGEVIDIKKLNVREKLKMIRARIEEIERTRRVTNEDTQNAPESLEDKDLLAQREAVHLPSNLTGAYDNTGVNCKAGIHRIVSLKYVTRQSKFKWLPTHVWQAKRAKMIKRWGWNIANEPTMKCFRKTSRSSRIKGCIAWDTSYINTIVVNCDPSKKDVLNALLSELTNGSVTKKKQYISGRKAWEGLIYVNKEPLCVGSVLQVPSEKLIRSAVRIHPSVYDVVIDKILSYVQDGIDINDCRYSIGSINVRGPKALTSLQSIFHTAKTDLAYKLWRKFSRLNDTETVPTGTVFSFEIQDPRLWSKSVIPHNTPETVDSILDSLLELQEGKGNNEDALHKLFSIEGRSQSYKNQQTLKQLGKRRTPERSGEPIPSTSKDPSIPISVIKSATNSYDVIVPWFWVMPIWYQLVHVPHLMIAGLKQMNQLAYEKGELSFEDMIFTRQGFINSQIKMRENARKWNRKPRSKRVQYNSLALGSERGEALSPFGCDWRSLQVLRYALQKIPPGTDSSKAYPSEFNKKLERVIKCKADVLEVIKDIKKADKASELLGRPLFQTLPVRLANKKEDLGEKGVDIDVRNLPPLPVRAVYFECTSRGHITDNARMYRIPADSLDSWLSFASNEEKDIRGRNVSGRMLGIPGSEYLVGLATSATFNLVKGFSTGVGFVDSSSDDDRLILRNVGSDVCHVCRVSYLSSIWRN